MSIEPIRRSSRRGAKKRVYAVGDLVEIHDVSISCFVIGEQTT